MAKTGGSVRVRVSTTWILTGTMLLAPVASNAEQAGELTVSATYKGKGVVDDTHEISVFLFDHPNPTAESTPDDDASHHQERRLGHIQGPGCDPGVRGNRVRRKGKL